MLVFSNSFKHFIFIGINCHYWLDEQQPQSKFYLIFLRFDMWFIMLILVLTSFFIFQKLNVPWLAMAKSLPLYACLFAEVCGAWMGYTILTSIPDFMKSVLKFNIKSVSFSVLTVDRFWQIALNTWPEILKCTKRKQTWNTNKQNIATVVIANETTIYPLNDKMTRL